MVVRLYRYLGMSYLSIKCCRELALMQVPYLPNSSHIYAMKYHTYLFGTPMDLVKFKLLFTIYS